MSLLQVILFFILCSVGLGWLARRANVPYPIALVVGGGALSFVPGLPHLEIDPQFLLVLVLPPILYQAALLTSWRDFKANMRRIGLLSIGLVIATTLVVGAALKLMFPDIPWAAAFVFGAIVSPPDAVAATAILSRMSIPRRIVTILEGESLVNDASGLVLYKFAVAAVLTGVFSVFDASVQFVVVAAGGVVIGLVIGWVFISVHKYMGDPFVEVLLSLSIPYTAYILAESVHLSGVLAVVAAGMMRGRYTPEIVSAEMRILARSVWNILVFLLNSLIFMLIGMELSRVLERLDGYSGTQLAFSSFVVTVVAIVVRFAWVYGLAHVPLWFSATLRERWPAPPRDELFLESWCGMRGIVSLAAALALPLQINDGTPFPYRDLIVFLTFVVIAVTLVVQGLSMPVLIRRLKLAEDVSTREEHRRARTAMGNAALATIDRIAAQQDASAELIARLKIEFTERMSAVEQGHEAGTEAALAKVIRLAAIKSERQELIRVWRESQISDEVLHHLEEELDYEESRL
jgi:CPA1 family monovalent cation:H+ antiporter